MSKIYNCLKRLKRDNEPTYPIIRYTLPSHPPPKYRTRAPSSVRAESVASYSLPNQHPVSVGARRR